MVKLVAAKCPSCGAALKLKKSDEKVECEYCHQTIIVDDAIACYKLKISGNVSVDGISTNSELIKNANDLLEMNEFLKAKKKFLEYSEKNPTDYQGWLGLLKCRTRNFTIRDNNALFENDINKYYDNYMKTAPNDIKDENNKIIEEYMNPNSKTDNTDTNSDILKNKWVWVIMWILCFPIPSTILLMKNEKMNNIIKYSLIGAAWMFYILFMTYSQT
ncbi:MAG: hypothetical protein IKQ35_01830 [Bacilli bacterium]|nr:hypothetical protein [Bacilli bacterium]